MRCRQAVQLQLDLGEEAERAFRSDQQLRRIERCCAQCIKIVTAYTTEQLREMLLDLVRQLGMEVAQRAQGLARQIACLGEEMTGAIGQDGLDAQHVLDHDAVLDRARAAGIIAGHAADRRAVGRRDVDREAVAGRLQLLVQMVEHDARLDRHRLGVEIGLQHLVHVAADINDQRAADRLAALRGAGAARQHRDAGLARDLDGGRDVLGVLGLDHADRLDLVDRGIGRIAAAGEGVETHLALDRFPESRGQIRIARLHAIT